MATKAGTSPFQGKFVYYENINGKSKKIEKNFTNQRDFDNSAQKYPMPDMTSLFAQFLGGQLGVSPEKKAVAKTKAPAKKAIAKKSPAKVKKVVKKK